MKSEVMHVLFVFLIPICCIGIYSVPHNNRGIFTVSVWLNVIQQFWPAAFFCMTCGPRMVFTFLNS